MRRNECRTWWTVATWQVNRPTREPPTAGPYPDGPSLTTCSPWIPRRDLLRASKPSKSSQARGTGPAETTRSMSDLTSPLDGGVEPAIDASDTVAARSATSTDPSTSKHVDALVTNPRPVPRSPAINSTGCANSPTTCSSPKPIFRGSDGERKTTRKPRKRSFVPEPRSTKPSTPLPSSSSANSRADPNHETRGGVLLMLGVGWTLGPLWYRIAIGPKTGVRSTTRSPVGRTTVCGSPSGLFHKSARSSTARQGKKTTSPRSGPQAAASANGGALRDAGRSASTCPASPVGSSP